MNALARAANFVLDTATVPKGPAFPVRMRKGIEDIFGAAIPGWGSGQGVDWANNPKKQVQQNLNYVYACTTLLADRLSSLDWSISARMSRKRGDWQDLADYQPDNPALHLFENPNPFDTFGTILNFTGQFLDTTGKAFWYVPKNGLRAPAEIWILYSQHMKVVPDKDSFIKGFLYQPDESKPPVALDPDEVVYFRYPDLQNLWDGMSPLAAQANSVDLDRWMRGWNANFMKNGAQLGGVLIPQEDLDEDGLNRLQEIWRQAKSGWTNAGKTAILTRKFEWKPLQPTMKELAYLDSDTVTLRQICAGYKVPPSFFNAENVRSLVALQAAEALLARNAISPRARLIADTINKDLLPLFDPRLLFEFLNVVPADREARRKDWEAGVDTWLTRDEVRGEMGLEARGGEADRLHIEAAKRPLAEKGGQEPTPEPEPEPAPELEPAPPPGGGQDGGTGAEDDQDGEGTTRGWTDIRNAAGDGFLLPPGTPRALVRLAREHIDDYSDLGLHPVLKATADDARKVRAKVKKIVPDDQKAGKRMHDVSLPEIRKAFADGIDLAHEMTAPGDFAVDHADAERWFTKEVPVDRFVQVSKKKTAEIRRSLAAGIADAEMPRDLRQRVEDVYGGFKRWESNRIARTETVRAQNAGILQTYLSEGDVGTKVWISTLDELTRESHAVADGQERQIDKNFVLSSGASGPAPGQIGVPEEDINCRCTVAPGESGKAYAYARRRELSAAFVKRQEPRERALEAALSAFFAAQEKEVLAAFDREFPEE